MQFSLYLQAKLTHSLKEEECIGSSCSEYKISLFSFIHCTLASGGSAGSCDLYLPTIDCSFMSGLEFSCHVKPEEWIILCRTIILLRHDILIGPEEDPISSYCISIVSLWFFLYSSGVFLYLFLSPAVILLPLPYYGIYFILRKPLKLLIEANIYEKGLLPAYLYSGSGASIFSRAFKQSAIDCLIKK